MADLIALLSNYPVVLSGTLPFLPKRKNSYKHQLGVHKQILYNPLNAVTIGRISVGPRTMFIHKLSEFHQKIKFPETF